MLRNIFWHFNLIICGKFITRNWAFFFFLFLPVVCSGVSREACLFSKYDCLPFHFFPAINQDPHGAHWWWQSRVGGETDNGLLPFGFFARKGFPDLNTPLCNLKHLEITLGFSPGLQTHRVQSGIALGLCAAVIVCFTSLFVWHTGLKFYGLFQMKAFLSWDRFAWWCAPECAITNLSLRSVAKRSYSWGGPLTLKKAPKVIFLHIDHNINRSCAAGPSTNWEKVWGEDEGWCAECVGVCAYNTCMAIQSQVDSREP